MGEGLDAPTVAGPLDAEAFQRRLDELNPAAMLVRVESRMSAALRARVTPEDLWQETLLCAWRDRASFVWRGPTEFRSWLLEIAEHRIHDLVERLGAAKRDAGREPLPLRAGDPDSHASGLDPAANGKTPSSAAAHAEEAVILREALASLPELYREVLRLRLFEEWDRDRIARELGLSLPAVKHRIRLGAVLYREKLAQVMSSRVAGC
ncbi:MAG: sigma-70 family RNA polymerase sigma factor [Planctomycetota bacterium]